MNYEVEKTSSLTPAVKESLTVEPMTPQVAPQVAPQDKPMTAEEVLDRNGFDFAAFEFENEHSAKNLLSAMEEYASKPTVAEKEVSDEEINHFLDYLNNTRICFRTSDRVNAYDIVRDFIGFIKERNK